MNLYLLDVAGAAGIFSGIGILVLLFFTWAVVEGLVLFLFRVNRFWKSVGQAALVNTISFIAGIVIFGALKNTAVFDKYQVSGETDSLPVWGALCLLTILIEGSILKLLNRSKPATTVFGATVVMNLLTYIIMFLLASASYN